MGNRSTNIQWTIIIDYISSILFQPNQSLLAYLRGNINSKDNASSAVVTLLGFLVSFIEKAQRIIQPYAVSIKNCLMKLASGGSSKIRCAAIETLCTLVNPTKSYLDMEELRLGSMFKLFVDDYSLVVTKTPLSVKGRMMELFGVLIRYHSEKLETGKIQTIERWAFTALEKELFSHKEADNQLVAGVLTGLDHMLFSSTLDLDQDSPQTELLYKSIQTTINLPEHLSRYVIPLAGLTLFNNHGDMFHKFIIRDSESLYKSLRTLCEHQNRDLSSLGYRAMEKLLKEVREEKKEIDTRYEAAYAKSSSTLSNRDRAKLTGHLPAFIQAYTYFAQSLTNVTPSFMSTIIELVNTFISNYIHLNTITRSTGIFAIRDLLRTLYYKGEGTLRSFLNDFLYNTLITTCTDDHASNYDGQPSYMEFLYFWDVFLNTSAYRSYNNRGRFRQKLGGCNDSKAIDTDSDATDDELDDVKDNEKGGINMDLQSILFDEFLTTLFRLIKTFNLELKKRDDESTDNIEGIATPSMLQAVNEDHFSIFQNLVEFWCMLLPKLNTHRLEHWTYLTASSLIEISLRRPLISGFYKMLSAILNIAHKRKLFDGYKELYAAQQRRKQLGTICDISEIQTDLFSAFVIYRDFLKEVWHRLQQFKDELLASCLRVILAYPLAFFDLSELVEPIRTAFRLGLTVYTLSDIALDVLYELTDIDSNKPDDLNSFLGDILPCMNEYMLMDLKPKREDGDISMVKKWKPTSGNQRKRQAIHYKVAQEAFGAQEAESTVSLRDIQLRVMRFLGRIGGVNKLMLKPITTGTQNINDDDGGIKNVASNTLGSRQQLISWDTKKNLKINLPFPNSKVPLAMGKNTHYDSIHILGKKNDKKSNESRYHRIYLHVFPILLRLAIDTEPITRDMFSLLVRQLIHWLTNNAQYENPETIALLKACIDATCSTDAGLRDYGADCMQEFVLWSIRQQQGSRTKESSAMNIKSVLKRIYNLASNPSSRQRLGACIIFNRIYRTFREEDALVNEFTLELLYWLFFSLKLAEDDHPLIGTLDQAKEAIGHIRRIIRQKINVFIVGKFGRREFHGIAENPPNLASVVGWAFDETGSIQREYSRECMKFFDEFVGRIPKVKNGKEWLSTRIKNTPELLENAYEHDRCLSVTDMKNKDGILWLQELRAALDGYNWLLKRGMITLMFLLEMPHLDWVEACVYLLDHSAENMFGAKTSIEKSNANALYAYLYHHLVVLITHATDTPMDTDEVLEAFLSRGILANENFISVVVQLLLLPNQFVESAKSEQGSMPNRLNPKKIRWAVRDFLQFMVERGPPRFHRLFEKACSTVLYSQNVDLTNMQLNQSALNDMLQIVDGIKILQELGLFDNICKALPKMSGGAESAYDYSLALYDKFIQFNATTEPVWIRLIGEMLQIAFRQPEFAAEYAKKLLLEQNLTYATQLATYQKFSSHINNCIASNFRYFAPVLLAHSDNRFIHDVIIGLVEYLRREKKLVKREIQVFVKDVSFMIKASSLTGIITYYWYSILLLTWKYPVALDRNNIFT
ncbi:hypothetical protein BDA99DRAFT_438520 [Phascolomyces articulosus]|uniref:Uncharacterized protein n=1 Tax=Phascolomyces articulosus TaxID=60185 RepID=A0AAD5PDW4_9FUNG|nr:hypothetical protein BDA99DRAFT_438520 [Phascolomyces articulosus]